MDRSNLGESRFWTRYNRHRYQILFFTLLFTLAAMPIATFFQWGSTAIELLFGAILMAAVMPLGTPRRRRMLIIVVVVVLLARPVATEADLDKVSETALGLWALVGLLAAAGALRFVLKADQIGGEHVFAALSAYLLAGVFFGVTYWAIEVALPGSFAGPSDFSRESAVYFSFVTLATLGYGDFLPKTDMTRGIVVFEVIGGQLFLAVMVARLIGLYTDTRKSD
ncbi:potassium channel family protein [Sphingomonas sp. NSE70-1]|uniref:Potassium channel family protein n=1 Tax=Sphingomonas caseinilyticus TaxID=2908205 RepID=A0ABT0RTL2_9SPHN|nr:potassium channel family protein [Sphingomonas caseinilyticus]